jgi:glutathione S-transferase
MRLHVFPPSPNARKVLIALAHQGIEAEIRIVDLFKGEQRSPEYLKLNPNGLMPTLEDGDFVLWESNAILQYLGAKKPETGLWPSGVRAQADVMRWVCWQLAHWGRACGTLTFENLVKQLVGMGNPDPSEVARGEQEIARFGEVLNAHLKGRDWLVGGGMTIADIAVGVWLTYWERARFPLQPFREILRWYDGLESQPAWKKATPPPLPS